jgi:hypothetical protein
MLLFDAEAGGYPPFKKKMTLYASTSSNIVLCKYRPKPGMDHHINIII